MSNSPLVDGVFIYERDDFERIKRSSKMKWLGAVNRLIGEIKNNNIEVCLDLSLNPQFGFFAWWAGIRKRVGFNYKNRGRFLTDKITIDGFDTKHVVEYYLDLLSLVNVLAQKYPMHVYSDAQSKRWVNEFLEKNRLGGKLIIGIAPCGGQAFGPSAAIKRWPRDKFTCLISRLIKELGAKVFIFAGVGEKSDVLHIMQSLKDERSESYEFTAASLPQMIALIEQCSLVVANDTGPLRFADALGKKIVALFGPVDERVYGPYPYEAARTIVLKKDVPCSPCYRKFRLSPCLNNRECLRGITVEEVFESVRKLVGERYRAV